MYTVVETQYIPSGKELEVETLVFETIRDFLAEELAYEPNRITPATALTEDLGLELSELGDLMLMLEQEFDLDWSDTDLQSISTIGDLMTLVEGQM